MSYFSDINCNMFFLFTNCIICRFSCFQSKWNSYKNKIIYIYIYIYIYNKTRMLHAILNKSWKQPTKSSYTATPISKTIQIRGTRHCKALLQKQGWNNKWHSSMDPYIWMSQQELIYISSMWTLDVVWETCWEWWRIGMDRKRESGKSMLWVWFDDNIENQLIFILKTLNFCTKIGSKSCKFFIHIIAIIDQLVPSFGTPSFFEFLWNSSCKIWRIKTQQHLRIFSLPLLLKRHFLTSKNHKKNQSTFLFSFKPI